MAIFYDAPLSRSGELARRSREIFASRGLTVQAAAVPVPERELAAFPGAIATSDTALIDAHQILVDLAGEIIRRQQGVAAYRPGRIRRIKGKISRRSSPVFSHPEGRTGSIRW